MTDDELEAALGICCGNTTDMQDHIHKTLQLLANRSDANTPSRADGWDSRADGWDKGTEALKVHLVDLYSPMGTVYLHFLDRLGLIEHGCGIAGSWLSSEGREVLEELNKRKPLDAIVEATS